MDNDYSNNAHFNEDDELSALEFLIQSSLCNTRKYCKSDNGF